MPAMHSLTVNCRKQTTRHIKPHARACACVYAHTCTRLLFLAGRYNLGRGSTSNPNAGGNGVGYRLRRGTTSNTNVRGLCGWLSPFLPRPDLVNAAVLLLALAVTSAPILALAVALALALVWVAFTIVADLLLALAVTFAPILALAFALAWARGGNRAITPEFKVPAYIINKEFLPVPKPFLGSKELPQQVHLVVIFALTTAIDPALPVAVALAILAIIKLSMSTLAPFRTTALALGYHGHCVASSRCTT